MMGDIYKGSTITIATTDTDKSSKSFLRRKGIWAEPPPLVMNWTHGLSGIRGYLGVNPLVKDPVPWSRPFDQFRVHSHWYDRGWTMQEWLLSPRILCIGQRGTTWDCLHHARSEYNPDEQWTPPDNSSAEDQKNSSGAVSRNGQGWKSWPSTAMRRLEPESVSECTGSFERSLFWTRLVNNYSCRQFTEEKDKFPALAGIVQSYLETTVAAGEPPPTYLAGLWWYQNELPSADRLSELPQGLAWVGEIKRPSVYRAPSWSWASGDGYVNWPASLLPARSVNLKICDAKCVYEPVGSFSSVKEGWIEVEGPLKRMWCHRTGCHLHPTPESAARPSESCKDRPWSKIPNRHSTIEDYIQSQFTEIETGEIFLLVVNAIHRDLTCLVMERVDCDKNDSDLDCFRRLGVTWVDEIELEEARIENWAIQRVRLV